MANKNSLVNLKMFSSTYQPKNAGRKPSQLKKLIKDNNLSSADISFLAANLVYNMTKEQLKLLVEDIKKPAGVRAIAKAVLNSYLKDTKDNRNFLMQLTERGFGQPKQQIELGEIEPDITELNPEERNKLIDEYTAELVKEKMEAMENGDIEKD